MSWLTTANLYWIFAAWIYTCEKMIKMAKMGNRA